MKSSPEDNGEPLYAIPYSEPNELAVAPRKTSWDAGTATSQIELRKYLDHIAERVESRRADGDGGLALRLDVGLPAGIDPLFEHDLDNFLHPVIKRLGGSSFVTAWATKAPGERSYVRIEPARPAEPESGWERWAGRATVSTAHEREWKDQVKAALAGATEISPGPVGVQVSLTVGPERSWPNLWKMAIDCLDPLLGRSFPDDEYDPKDGRVVRLGIHVRKDPSVGWDVPFVIRARPADFRWPEMAWFAAMSEGQRAAWLAEHERRCTPNRRSRRGQQVRRASVPVATGSGERSDLVGNLQQLGEGETHPETHGVALAAVEGIREIRSVDAFRAALGAGELLVITDSAKPAKLHPAAARCAGVSENYFVGKVIERGGRGGKYFTVASAQSARERWPRITICATCR